MNWYFLSFVEKQEFMIKLEVNGQKNQLLIIIAIKSLIMAILTNN